MCQDQVQSKNKQASQENQIWLAAVLSIAWGPTSIYRYFKILKSDDNETKYEEFVEANWQAMKKYAPAAEKPKTKS